MPPTAEPTGAENDAEPPAITQRPTAEPTPPEQTWSPEPEPEPPTAGPTTAEPTAVEQPSVPVEQPTAEPTQAGQTWSPDPEPTQPAAVDQPTAAEWEESEQAWSPQAEPAVTMVEKQRPAAGPPSAELSIAKAEFEPASPTVEEQHAREVAEDAVELEEEPTSELPTMGQLDALSAELDEIDAVLAHMDGPAKRQPAT